MRRISIDGNCEQTKCRSSSRVQTLTLESSESISILYLVYRDDLKDASFFGMEFFAGQMLFVTKSVSLDISEESKILWANRVR